MMRYLMLFGCLLLWASPVSAQGFDGGSLAIESEPGFDSANELLDYIDYRGSGCRQGDVDGSLSSDGRYLDLRYFGLDVFASDGSEVWRDCQVEVGVFLPRGYRVGVRAVQVSGFTYTSDASSVAGIRVESRTAQHRWPVVITNRQQRGYYNQEFRFVDTLPVQQTQWSVCGTFENRHTFNIDSRVDALAARGGRVELSGTRATRSVDQVVLLEWERCDNLPPPPPPSGEWIGSCRVVLETIWGEDVDDFWGESCERSRNAGIAMARDEGLRKCERVRNGANLMKCSVDNAKCTASRH